MKRDWNITREILEATEEDRLCEYVRKSGADYSEDDLTPQKIKALENENAELFRRLVLYHIELCADSVFLRNVRISYDIEANPYNVNVFKGARLTMKGCDFLLELRSKTMWGKIKETAKDAGLELTTDVIREVGIGLAKRIFAN